MSMNKKKLQLIKKNNWNYFKRAAAFIFLLFLPTQLGKHFFFPFSYISGIRVDYLAPTIYIVDIAFLFLLVVNFKAIIKRVSDKKFLFFLGVLLVNGFFSRNKFLALYQSLRLVQLATIFYIFSKKVIAEKLTLWAITLSAIFELILSLCQFITKHSLQGLFYFFGERLLSLSTPGVAKASLLGIEILRPYGTFSHPNSLAGFYMLLYVFVLTTKKFDKHLLLKTFFLFLSSLLIFFSFSKVALGLYLLINLLFLLKSPLKKICRPCVIGRLLVLVVLCLVFFQARSDPLSLKKRLVLSQNSLAIIGKNPLVGTGIGNYLLAQNYFSRPFFDLINQPVHNIFLLFFSEYGLVMGGIIIALFWKQVLEVWKKNPYVFIVIVISGLFDHYWLTLIQNFLLLGVVFGSL